MSPLVILFLSQKHGFKRTTVRSRLLISEEGAMTGSVGLESADIWAYPQPR